MDKEIFERYLTLKPPFDGKVLYTKSKLSLDVLRKLVELTIEFFKINNYLNGKIFKVWDWLEHDRYLSQKEIISDNFLINLTKNTVEFYLNRSGDTNVKLGLYDEFSNWYIRIYIIDEYDLRDGEELGGTFDISASIDLLNSLNKYLITKGYDVLQFSETILYFGNIIGEQR